MAASAQGSFCRQRTVEFGMYVAISNFNMGAKIIFKLLDELNIPSGKYTQRGCGVLDKERIDAAECKKDSSKKRRKILRGKKKKKRKTKNRRQRGKYMLREHFNYTFLLFVSRKYTIINANLKLVNTKIHSFYSIEIH